jgi:hypothetical protein
MNPLVGILEILGSQGAGHEPKIAFNPKSKI